MKRFLFVLNGVTPIDEMVSLGKALEQKTETESYYFITKKNLSENLLRSGVKSERIISPPAFNSRIHRFFIFKILSELKFCRDLLSKFQINGIGLYGDFNLSFCLSFIRAAALRDIKTFVLPIAISDPAFISTSRLRYDKKVSPFGKNLVRLLWPQQIYTIEGTEIPFYPFFKTVILYFLKMLPPKPWYMGAGNADHVFLQFPFQKEQLVAIGVVPDKLHVTGQSAFDSLAMSPEEKEKLQLEIFHTAGFSTRKKTIVVAVPQLAEHKLMSWEEHRKVINELIERLKGLNCQLLLSLHPKMDPKNYDHYVEPGLVYLSPYPLKKILPLGDFFVAGFGSTVYWAMALKIPALFLSYLNLGYTFKDVPGVKELKSPDEIAPDLLHFASSKEISIRKTSHCVDTMISIVGQNI